MPIRKHRWLYLDGLDSLDSLRRHFATCVEDHNTLIPRMALAGRTPDEAFLGTASDVPRTLATERTRA